MNSTQEVIQEDLFSASELTLAQTADVLGISQATVRNWVRAGHLENVGGKRGLLFRQNQVRDLKSRIAAGEIDRLTRRANKTRAQGSALHAELVPDDETRQAVNRVLTAVSSNELSVSSALLAVAIGVVRRQERIEDPGSYPGAAAKFGLLDDEITRWASEDALSLKELKENRLCSIEVRQDIDVLGACYQNLTTTGDKNRQGAYFTPSQAVHGAANAIIEHAGPTLDPCCGTGAFLLGVLSKFLQFGVSRPLDLLCGVEIDPLAARVARINLLLSCPSSKVSAPNVLVADTFSVSRRPDLLPFEKFEYVLSNPPWGARVASGAGERDQPREMKETFAAFLSLGLDWLQDDGRLSYLLPESFLNVRMHAAIRERVSNGTTILTISDLGRIFSDVYTPVIRIDLQKAGPSKNHKVSIEGQDTAFHEIAQQRFVKASDYVFSIGQSAQDESILQRMESVEHFTLRGQSQWALGIVTGDNKKYVLTDSEAENSERVLRGKDVFQFSLGQPETYIVFDRSKFQQVAPDHFYRASEKLLYRFISKYLCFAYDDQQTLTLNSANILIPEVPGISIKYVMALLNSRPIQFYFQKKFSSLKVLRSHVEQLPLPRPPSKMSGDLKAIVATLLSGDLDRDARKRSYADLDELVMEAFDFSSKEKAQIRGIEIPDKLLG